MMTTATHITQLLDAHRAGDDSAFNRLMTAIYDDLRRLARSQRRAGAGRAARAGMATTDLVHEAYLKLARSEAVDARDRGHLFALVSRAMRQIFVDFAKNSSRLKRGGGAHHTGLDGKEIPADGRPEVVLTVDLLLEHLATRRPRMVRVVECRWFGGLSEEETAQALDTSVSTVQREWREAKALLRASLAPSAGGQPAESGSPSP